MDKTFTISHVDNAAYVSRYSEGILYELNNLYANLVSAFDEMREVYHEVEGATVLVEGHTTPLGKPVFMISQNDYNHIEETVMVRIRAIEVALREYKNRFKGRIVPIGDEKEYVGGLYVVGNPEDGGAPGFYMNDERDLSGFYMIRDVNVSVETTNRYYTNKAGYDYEIIDRDTGSIVAVVSNTEMAFNLCEHLNRK